MNEDMRELLNRHPQAAEFYERNPDFKQAIDALVECIESAREELSDQDYAEFLSYMVAHMREWTA